MDNQKNRFDAPHFVAMTLVKQAKDEAFSMTDYIQHKAYYHQPEMKNKVVFYGEVLNQATIYIVIYVKSDEEFEQIIINDPGINARLYELKTITPFNSNVIETA